MKASGSMQRVNRDSIIVMMRLTMLGRVWISRYVLSGSVPC